MTLVVKIRGGASTRIEPPMDISIMRTAAIPSSVLKKLMGYHIGQAERLDGPTRIWRVAQRQYVQQEGDEFKVADNLHGQRWWYVRFYQQMPCQPADDFIIKSIKEMWRAEWDKEKRRLAEDNLFQTPHKVGKYSGKLKTPGKN